jgi:hypothetical protein
MNFNDVTLPHQARTNIHALGQFLQSFLDRHTEVLLNEHTEHYQQLFETMGDMAYGKFNTLLFTPVRRALEKAGLKAVPRLPGSFQRSREWGNAEETHQQRWFTSRIVRADEAPLGTLAVGSHHDHSKFRLPRSPEIVALDATRPTDVVAALSEVHIEYGQAEEFKIWYTKFLADGV